MSPLETLIGEMTIEQFARLTNTTVEQIVTAALAGSRHRAALATVRSNGRVESPAAAAASPGNGTPGRGGKSAARARGSIHDDEVLAILRDANEPISSEHVRSRLGGTPAQVRAALHRLRDAKRIRVEGKKRGTRYAPR